MANLIRTTKFSSLKAAGASFTITLDQATTAGSTLVFFIGGGGIATTVRITNGSGATFSKRTGAYVSGSQDVSMFDFTAVGGETAVHVTLNGAENVAGCVHEVSGLGSFIGAGRSNSLTVNGTVDNAATCPTGTSVTGNSVMIAGFAREATLAGQPYNDSNRFHQFGPAGRIVSDGAIQPGADAQLIWASGVADITASTRYPYSEAAGSHKASSVMFGGGNGYVAQVVYANAGANINPAVNAVERENSMPGSIYNNWFLSTEQLLSSAISGYTDKPSYAVGDTVGFKVYSNNASFQIEIIRLGFYGDDNFGGRKVGVAVGTPAVQPAPSVDGTTGATTCAWSTTASWAIPADAAPGVYYALMRRTDGGNQLAAMHFVIRGSTAGKIAFVLPDLTYQAYNMWGGTSDVNGSLTGRSVYGANGTTNNATRGYAVSWDRPMSTGSHMAQTYVFDAESAFINFGEAQGYDFAYLSDHDLERDPTLLNSAAMVCMVGHHEYWTTNVYNAYQSAIDAGINTMIAGSNIALWRTRFAAGDTNKRTMICYKDSITRDSSAGFTGTGYDPVTPTGTWRDANSTNGTPNPDRRCENAITGQLFIGNGAIQDAAQVPFASKTSPIWRNSSSVQALTSGQSYTTTGFPVMGYEMEYPSVDAFRPANMVLLNPHTANYAGKGANANGTLYNGNTGDITVSFTMYRAASGALVFNTGSWRGWNSVSRWRQAVYNGAIAIDRNWQNALLSVMYDLGARINRAPVGMQTLVTETPPTDPSVGAPGPNRNAVALAYGLTVPAAGFGYGFFVGVQ